jgi:hypothetical protein
MVGAFAGHKFPRRARGTAWAWQLLWEGSPTPGSQGVESYLVDYGLSSSGNWRLCSG